MTAPAVIRRLRETFEHREGANRNAVRSSRVLGRNEDGTQILQRLDGECTARGCVTAEGEGEIVRRPAGPCWGNQGTTGVALAAVRGVGRFYWVDSIDPSSYDPGASYTVTVLGHFLTPTLLFDFLLPDSEEVNPYITITEVRWIDASSMEIDIDVDPSARAVVVAALAYGDQGPAN